MSAGRVSSEEDIQESPIKMKPGFRVDGCQLSTPAIMEY